MRVTTTVRLKIYVPDASVRGVLDDEDENYTVEKLICESIGYTLDLDDSGEIEFVEVVEIESVNDTDLILQER